MADVEDLTKLEQALPPRNSSTIAAITAATKNSLTPKRRSSARSRRHQSAQYFRSSRNLDQRGLTSTATASPRPNKKFKQRRAENRLPFSLTATTEPVQFSATKKILSFQSICDKIRYDNSVV
jgi:hypothetical protein